MTDEEVENGIIKCKERNQTTLCFIRTLEDINLKHGKAWRFIDVDDNGTADTHSQTLLDHIKYDKIPGVLDKKNIFNFNIKWSDNEGINPTDHEGYLDEFCETFEREVLRLVDDGVRVSHHQHTTPVYKEIIDHSHQAREKCTRFYGRVDVLDSVRHYIISDSHSPLVIHGLSGCGKSSIMAKAAIMVRPS